MMNLVIGMIRDILSRPVSVLEAKDGRRRCTWPGEHDLILWMMMPRWTDLGADSEERPATAQIPLIFISALGASRDKVRGLNLRRGLPSVIEPDELQT
jgi:DNA-binding response OmpR family regulator